MVVIYKNQIIKQKLKGKANKVEKFSTKLKKTNRARYKKTLTANNKYFLQSLGYRIL